ncbi:sensor histidine kinase [Paenibacillus thermoaerophilus]|uniref:histidine kinase n=1 Tax=Paenibacillus thermoaerophilus TaxID=1215385 RepID=A0ABW2V8A1_9BACL|nr:ATP-binding protein [Paenibacillus thermoaerophilus]TMV16107.1 HAMP domain-containing histidine kinase [Paenibacillus thermoaerophilus]
MKIKTWLLLSYFIVMILPLTAAFVLFAWIQAYHQDLNVEEYVQKRAQLQSLVSVLDDPKWYEINAERAQVEKLIQPQVSIVLYNRDGVVLYTSDPLRVSPQFSLGRKSLYENLYALQQGYRAYSYKQPVFSGRELVGFFDIQLSRDEWVSGVSQRVWLVAGLFIGLFALIYLAVAIGVHRKLNSRLNHLMRQMTAFAQGDTVRELPEGKDEIGHLTGHFHQMRRQIEAARQKLAQEQREKEFMIAAISHDLKTPLMSICAYAESLASEQALSAREREEYRGIIFEKAHYMKQMLDDLLMYTLLQSPTYEIERVEVDGGEFFDMLVSDYEPLCKEKHIELLVRSEVRGNVRVNPNQMIRVADNLMSNALRHTKPGMRIWLAAASSDRVPMEWLFDFVKEEARLDRPDSVFLIVQNEGEGIAPDKLPHVFDPLYQADPARRKQEARGAGLGLSITRRILEKHGGDVAIYSKEKIGSCVICRLPFMNEEGEPK